MSFSSAAAVMVHGPGYVCSSKTTRYISWSTLTDIVIPPEALVFGRPRPYVMMYQLPSKLIGQEHDAGIKKNPEALELVFNKPHSLISCLSA